MFYLEFLVVFFFYWIVIGKSKNIKIVGLKMKYVMVSGYVFFLLGSIVMIIVFIKRNYNFGKKKLNFLFVWIYYKLLLVIIEVDCVIV